MKHIHKYIFATIIILLLTTIVQSAPKAFDSLGNELETLQRDCKQYLKDPKISKKLKATCKKFNAKVNKAFKVGYPLDASVESDTANEKKVARYLALLRKADESGESLRKLTTKACDGGNDRGCLDLGNMFYDGKGIIKNNKEEGMFHNGKQDGLTTRWYLNGQKKEESHWKNGKQDGLFAEWYKSGEIKRKSEFKDGKQDGLSTRWYINGQKEEESYWKNGKQDGLLTEWYESGGIKRISEFKYGKADGTGSTWYKSGQIENKYHFKDGISDGLGTIWYENGKKKVEGKFKDGKKDGWIREWYKNGVKKNEAMWKNDKLNGSGTQWYETGQKKSESKFKDGKQDGMLTEWYKNGQKKVESNKVHINTTQSVNYQQRKTINSIPGMSDADLIRHCRSDCRWNCTPPPAFVTVNECINACTNACIYGN